MTFTPFPVSLSSKTVGTMSNYAYNLYLCFDYTQIHVHVGHCNIGMILPSAHRFLCTSAGCFGRGREQGRGQSRNGHTQ